MHRVSIASLGLHSCELLARSDTWLANALCGGTGKVDASAVNAGDIAMSRATAAVASGEDRTWMTPTTAKYAAMPRRVAVVKIGGLLWREPTSRLGYFVFTNISLYSGVVRSLDFGNGIEPPSRTLKGAPGLQYSLLRRCGSGLHGEAVLFVCFGRFRLY
jgi:hypothetical protein